MVVVIAMAVSQAPIRMWTGVFVPAAA